MTTARTCGVLLILAAALGGCDSQSAPDRETAAPSAEPSAQAPAEPKTDRPPTATPAATPGPSSFVPPEPDIDELPFAIQTKIGAARHLVTEEPDNGDKVFELGAMYYAHGRPAAAAKCFRHAVELLPDNFLRRYSLARALHEAGEREAAIKAYEEALAVQAELQQDNGEPLPPYPPARVYRATLIAERDPAEAVRLLRGIMSETTDTPVQIALAHALFKQGELDEAQEIVKRVLDQARDMPPAHALLAEILTAQGQPEEAAEHRKAAGNAKPSMAPTDPASEATLRAGFDVAAIFRHVEALLERRDIENAQRWLALATQLDETGVRARNMRGRLRMLQGLPQQAVELFEEALQADPNSHVARINLAEALVQLERVDEAEQYLRDVLKRDPTHLAALDRLTLLLEVQKRRAEIEKPLLAAAGAASEEPGMLYPLAQLFYRHGYTDQSLQALRQAIKLEPDFILAWYQLAMLQLQEGQITNARRALSKCLEINPVFTNALEPYVRILMQAGEATEAEQRLRTALEEQPNSPVLLNMLAWLLATRPNADPQQATEAVQLAEQANELTQFGNPGILDTLAAAHAAAGNFEQARARIAEAINKARAIANADPREQQRIAGLVQEYESRQALYEANTPYVER